MQTWSMESANAINLILLLPIMPPATRFAAKIIAIKANTGALTSNNVFAVEAWSSLQTDASTRAFMVLWLNLIQSVIHGANALNITGNKTAVA
jgi:hypothetical protein